MTSRMITPIMVTPIIVMFVWSRVSRILDTLFSDRRRTEAMLTQSCECYILILQAKHFSHDMYY